MICHFLSSETHELKLFPFSWEEGRSPETGDQPDNMRSYFILKVVIVCGGSYRRGKAFCGDLDVIVTHPDGRRSNFTSLLFSNKLI